MSGSEDLEQMKAVLEWFKAQEWERQRLTEAGVSLGYVQEHMERWALAHPRPGRR